MAKLAKITQAEAFIDTNEIDKALKIYKEVCLAPSLGVDEKYETFLSLYVNVESEALEILTRWRDMLGFVKGEELDTLISLLTKLTSVPGIQSHERVYTAVSLYNHCHLDICYRCFVDMTSDESIKIDHRVEACKYLLCSENPEYRTIAQECLTTIIETLNYPSEYRYRIIASFISRTGLATLMNAKKLRVPYDEEFVYGLQHVFFNNLKNGVRERILSGQHMIDMVCVPEDEKIQIFTELLEIASSKTFDENTRADAADVVLRLGSGDLRIKAHDIINELGYTAVDTSKTLLSKIRTVYNNSQNMHDEKISESVIKFIETMVKTSTEKLPLYNDVHSEISNLIRSAGLSPSDKISTYKALNRISVDTAKFSSYKVTIAEVLIHVWLKITRTKDDTKRALFEKRLIDELIDMGMEGGSCSTGHAGRIVNVLYDEAEIRISFESQILANIAGRMNARIRDVPDQNLKVSLTMGMMENAEKEDQVIYFKFIETNLSELRRELEKEFVGEGYLKQKDFDIFFSNSSKVFLKKAGAP